MIKKEIIIGLITGFIANISGLVLAILFLNDNPSIIEVVVKSFEERLLSKLISLGAIMNLFVFFVYIKKRQENRAKGVLMATIIIAIITIILNLI
jgi:cytochrome bd-type quinol oxidase subunit 1